ncbi:MAG: hypothetical protein K5634_01805 [Sphaerochaetaceae bacterium]|nr:hypothetical protein [Sphaerochaetaceae bacterium]
MKRRFFTNLSLILTVFILVSCSTVSTEEKEQIKTSALLLGEKYNSLEQHEKAVEVYEKALTQVSDYRINYNLAASLMLSKQYRKAAELCISSFEQYPHITAFKKLEKEAWLKLRQTEKAINVMEEILSLDPADTETREELMLLYRSKGLKEKALSCAEDLYNRRVITNAVLSILYESDNKKWEGVCSVLYSEEEPVEEEEWVFDIFTLPEPPQLSK